MIGTVSYRKQVKMSEIKKTKRHSPLSHGQSKHVSSAIRERVLKAASTLFRENGFSSTSMLDIVTRARVSKRDLYALFNNKHAVLAACISERAQQMRRPLDTATPVPQTRDALAKLLVELGVSILKTVCQPEVLTVYRLAIAESRPAGDCLKRKAGHNSQACRQRTEQPKPNGSSGVHPAIAPRTGVRRRLQYPTNAGLLGLRGIVFARCFAEIKTNASGLPLKVNITSSTNSGACIVIPAMSAPLRSGSAIHRSPTSILIARDAATWTS